MNVVESQDSQSWDGMFAKKENDRWESSNRRDGGEVR